MYYTNVDLYANLKQLWSLCRQEFYKCSKHSPVPAAAGGKGRADGGDHPSPVLPRRVAYGKGRDPQLGVRVPAPTLFSVSAEEGCKAPRKGRIQTALGCGGDMVPRIQLGSSMELMNPDGEDRIQNLRESHMF